MRKLIAGTSLSGKTTLAKEMARLYKQAGRNVLVLDEIMDPGWGADLLTDNPDIFLKYFWGSRNLAVFIDEAGESVGRYDKTMNKVATRGRHWGHIVHFVIQDPTQISRVVRSQNDECYGFALDDRGSEILAREFRVPELLKCVELEQGEYIHAMKFGPDKKPTWERRRIF